jgi:hypothetical protein
MQCRLPESFNKKNTIGGVYQNLLNDSKDLIINQYGETLDRETAKKLNLYTFFDYFDQYIAHTFIKNTTVPYLIIDTDGLFTNLDTVKYSSDLIDHLNQTGLEIYFWELPIFQLVENRQAVRDVITVEDFSKVENLELRKLLTKKTFEKVKHVITGFETKEVNINNLYSPEFEKINNFVTYNKLTNVTVCTGFYNLDKFIQKQYSNLKFKTKDIFLSSCVRVSDKTTVSSYNPLQLVPSADLIEHKFWSSNKRYEGYRHLIAAYLLDKSALVSFNSNLVSFNVKIQNNIVNGANWQFYWSDINNRLWFDVKSLKPHVNEDFYQNLKTLSDVGYLSIDKHPSDQDFEKWLSQGDADEDILVPIEHYQKCFCAIVTESTFAQPFAHFADKVLNTVKSHRPFIVAGPPCTLEYIKELGFKTFSDYWDESYDQELNHEQRLLKIFKVVDYINSKSLDELKYMYNDMVPILIHNHKNIATLASAYR